MRISLTLLRAYWRARHPQGPWPEAPEGPVVTPGDALRQFAAGNVLGLSLEQARDHAHREMRGDAPTYPGYRFGLSTGTTGEPGVFLTTERERDLWLGTILGKFLSPPEVWGLRAALLLRYPNALYNAGERVRFHDLRTPVKEWAAKVCDQEPNVLIGPPSALEALARSAAFAAKPFRPRLLLRGGEPTFPQDLAFLESAFGTRGRDVYQAREGFLAAGCAGGGLHWNDDVVAIRPLLLPAGGGRVTPVVTDRLRQSQQVVRYRMDDILLPGPACECRTRFTRFGGVEGRLGDVLLAGLRDGGVRPVYPLMANEALREIGEYRLRQVGPRHYWLATAGSPRWSRLDAIRELLGDPDRFELAPLRWEAPGEKRRRIVRLFDEENAWIAPEAKVNA